MWNVLPADQVFCSTAPYASWTWENTAINVKCIHLIFMTMILIFMIFSWYKICFTTGQLLSMFMWRVSMSVKRLHNYWVTTLRPLVFAFKPSLAWFWHPPFCKPWSHLMVSLAIGSPKYLSGFTVTGCRPAMVKLEKNEYIRKHQHDPILGVFKRLLLDKQCSRVAASRETWPLISLCPSVAMPSLGQCHQGRILQVWR